jgi:hypothetical protein
MWGLAAALAVAVANPSTLRGTVPQAVETASDSVTFVVLGHLRGDRDRGLSHLLDELLMEVERIDPAFAVLTGDNIWGDPVGELADKTVVGEEYDRLDAALAALGIPIFLIPGNHDVSDSGTYELFVDRYGELPRAVNIDGLRLILLNTAWDPGAGAISTTRGFNLGPSQIEFLGQSLADSSAFDHAFVFMHHILFWQEEHEPWWQEAHPLLVAGGAQHVFTGDYGPEKFSYKERDGVEYFQSGIAPNPALGILKGHEWNRLLAQQFDNFLEVTVRGPAVDVTVHTVGETSTGHFTPDLWRSVWGRTNRRAPREGGLVRLRAFLETGKAKLFTAGVLGLTLFVGFGIGWRVRRR